MVERCPHEVERLLGKRLQEFARHLTAKLSLTGELKFGERVIIPSAKIVNAMPTNKQRILMEMKATDFFSKERLASATNIDQREIEIVEQKIDDISIARESVLKRYYLLDDFLREYPDRIALERLLDDSGGASVIIQALLTLIEKDGLYEIS